MGLLVVLVLSFDPAILQQQLYGLRSLYASLNAVCRLSLTSFPIQQKKCMHAPDVNAQVHAW